MRARSKKLREAVATCINRWNPGGLIRGPANADEFQREIDSIVRQLSHLESFTEDDVVRAIERTLSSSFGAEFALPSEVQACGGCVMKLLVPRPSGNAKPQ